MRKYLMGGFGIAFIAATCSAMADQEVLDVWGGPPPGTSDATYDSEVSFEIENQVFGGQKDTLVLNVTRPSLTVVKPEGTPNGAAVIIAPGGGFRVLSYANEGVGVASYLSQKGFTCFILKYRLHPMPASIDEIQKGMAAMASRVEKAGAKPGARPNIPMGALELSAIDDGVQAVKLVRSKAADYGIDPERVGIIGFSAGGRVAGYTAITPDEADRPNFVGIIYSSVQDEIPVNAPPAFMAGAADDSLALGLTDVYDRWLTSGASAELHMYAKGQHGFATMKQNLPVDNWLDGFYAWIGQQGFL